MVSDQIALEVKSLQDEGFSVEIIETEEWFFVIFHSYPVNGNLSKSATELLIKLPRSYPNGKPDMFWTDVDLTLKDGRVPRSADQIETLLGMQWRRFSWHPQNWNPGSDNLRTFLEFVNARLAKAE